MKKLLKLVVAAAAALSFGAHAGILIDDFSTDQTLISDGTANGVGIWSQVNGAGILGGYRDIYVNKIAGPTGGTQTTAMDVSGGSLSFANGSQTNGEGIVRWDGATAGSNAALAGNPATYGIDATGLGGIDFASQAVAFKITVTAADLGFPFRLQAFTDAGNYTTLDLVASGPGVFLIPFAAFAGGASVGTGINFSNVGALQAIINTGGATTAVDITIDLVEAVPEPGSLALVGLGLLGLGVISRRKLANKQ